MSSRRFYGFVLVLSLTLLGWVRFSSALTIPGATVAVPGDGQGTIAWFYEIHEQFKAHGGALLWGDSFKAEGIGRGFDVSVPSNFLWRGIIVGLSTFFSSDDVYDVFGFIAFVLNGIAAYVLGRRAGLNAVFAAVCAFLVVDLFHFSTRLGGHVSLAAYFLPTLIIAQLLTVTRAPRGPQVFWLAGLCVLNFLLNEYYGYFGLWVAGLALIPILNSLRYHSKRENLQLGGWILFSAVMAVTLMVVCYPTIIGGKIFSSLAVSTAEDAFGTVAHAKAEFDANSISSYFGMLQPGIPQIVPVLNSLLRRTLSPTGEASTLRLGIIVPLVAAGGMVFAVVGLGFRAWRRPTRIGPSLAAFFMLGAVALIAYQLALKPRVSTSLVRVTMAIAPMFRCGVRALIYANIAAIAMFCIVLQNLTLASIERIKAGQHLRFVRMALVAGVGLVVGLVAYVTHWDVSASPDFSYSYPTKQLEFSPIYSDLKNAPEGVVLELPFHKPYGGAHDLSYPYYLGRIVHKKSIVNIHLDDTRTVFVSDVLRVNRLPRATVQRLAAAGVRYVAYHGKEMVGRGISREDLRSRDDLTVLAERDADVLFEIVGAAPFDKKVFADLMLRPTEFTLAPDFFAESDIHGSKPFEVLDRVPLYRGQYEVSLQLVPKSRVEAFKVSVNFAYAGAVIHEESFAVVPGNAYRFAFSVAEDNFYALQITLVEVPVEAIMAIQSISVKKLD